MRPRRVPRGDIPSLVVFSPLPPLKNGIADYMAELLPQLAAEAAVTVVIDDHAPTPTPSEMYRVLRVAEYVAGQHAFEAVPHLYQLGNNADHVYLLPWLVKRPGVVVLHDVSLHHLVDQATLPWSDMAGYEAMLELEYGAAGRALADRFRETRRRPRSMFYELPLTRELLARSCAVIVHSLYAAQKVAAQQPDLPVVLVRHHLAASAVDAGTRLPRCAARAALGVPEDVLYLVSLGFVTRAKQIDTVLRFLSRNRDRLPKVRYVIVGQEQPEDYDVRVAMQQLGLQDIVSITGYVDEETFYQHVAASDIVVNLRYPSGGETSGTLIRALGVGACVVVNDIGPFAEYPDDVCPKVPLGPGDHDLAFERLMIQLADSPARRQRFARRAAQHVRATHALAESARRYLRTVASYGRRTVLPPPASDGASFLPTARLEAQLRASAGARRPSALPLWVMLGAVPLANADTQARVLQVGMDAGDSRWLEVFFGYAASCVDCWPHGTRPSAIAESPRRSHRVALLQLEADVTPTALASWLVPLNRRLVHNGHLLLNLTGTAPSSLAERKAMIRAALEAAGYVVELARTHRDQPSFAIDGDVAAASNGDDEQPQHLWRARKVSEFVSGALHRLAQTTGASR